MFKELKLKFVVVRDNKAVPSNTSGFYKLYIYLEKSS
jgi:hypothetical protein